MTLSVDRVGRLSASFIAWLTSSPYSSNCTKLKLIRNLSLLSGYISKILFSPLYIICFSVGVFPRSTFEKKSLDQSSSDGPMCTVSSLGISSTVVSAKCWVSDNEILPNWSSLILLPFSSSKRRIVKITCRAEA